MCSTSVGHLSKHSTGAHYRVAKRPHESMLTIFLALVCACVLGSCAVRRDPTAVAFPDALAAAAVLCPASTTDMSIAAQLASNLQSATTAPVLTCSRNSRSAFLDAIALPQPSGYPGDADYVPALVIQPVGTQADGCKPPKVFERVCCYQSAPAPHDDSCGISNALCRLLDLGRCFAIAADVEQAVRFAAENSLTIAVKGGGWSWVSRVCHHALSRY